MAESSNQFDYNFHLVPKILTKKPELSEITA